MAGKLILNPQKNRDPFQKEEKKRHGQWICWLCGFETNAEPKRNTIHLPPQKSNFPNHEACRDWGSNRFQGRNIFRFFKYDLDKCVEENLISITRRNEI